MIPAWRFLWISTRGYRLAPWRSPYLRWRIETYSGLPASQIGFTEFWGFLWRERNRFGRFLGWVEEMSDLAALHPPRPGTPPPERN